MKTYNITDLVKISKNDLWKYYPYFTRSETYIGAHYCSNFDDRVKIMLIQQDKYLYDNCQQWDESHEISTTLLKRLFKSFPKEGIDLNGLKKILCHIHMMIKKMVTMNVGMKMVYRKGGI